MRYKYRFGVKGWVVLAWVLVAVPSTGALAVGPCDVALAPPVGGSIVRTFVPADRGGHWGVDLASPPAGLVRAPVSGRITFAGRVAGRLSVTIAPSPRSRVSLSYLSELWVEENRVLAAGQPLGRSGVDHGLAAVHLSLRVGGRYLDPMPALECGRQPRAGWGWLRLLAAEMAVGEESGYLHGSQMTSGTRG